MAVERFVRTKLPDRPLIVKATDSDGSVRGEDVVDVFKMARTPPKFVYITTRDMGIRSSDQWVEVEVGYWSPPDYVAELRFDIEGTNEEQVRGFGVSFKRALDRGDFLAPAAASAAAEAATSSASPIVPTQPVEQQGHESTRIQRFFRHPYSVGTITTAIGTIIAVVAVARWAVLWR